MRNLIFVMLILLSACATTNTFKVGQLDCTHVVSIQLMGTSQFSECEKDGIPVYITSFSGTAAIDPLVKAAESGATIGILNNLPSVIKSDSVVHVRP